MTVDERVEQTHRPCNLCGVPLLIEYIEGTPLVRMTGHWCVGFDKSDKAAP